MLTVARSPQLLGYAVALFLASCAGEPDEHGNDAPVGGSGGASGGTAGRNGAAGSSTAGQAGGTAGPAQGGAASGTAGAGTSGNEGKGASGAGAGGVSQAGTGGLSGASGAQGGTLANGGSSQAGAGGAAAGAAGNAGSGAGSAGTGATLPSFLLGADISSIQEAVDNGTRYADTDGTEKSILEILKAHGFNTIRLRTFVNPGAEYGYAVCNGDEPYCDKAHTVEFAQAIKAAGMSLLLDFHYSDTWADPGKQVIPEAWRSANTIQARADLLKAYTVDVVTELVEAGARPDLVQVGNEITPGMLIHVPTSDTDCWGNNSTPASLTGSISNWDNLATLLKAGIAGVREVDASIKVMLHIENTDSLSGARSWISNARSRGVEFDVMGFSCYTAFQGQPSVWRSTFDALAEEFPELSFVIAEYNPERTAANEIMRDLPDGRGLGTFFWEPTQSGTWGDAMFTSMGGVMRANADDFAEFDALKAELGL